MRNITGRRTATAPPPERTATEDDDRLGSYRSPYTAAGPASIPHYTGIRQRDRDPPTALPVTVAEAQSYAQADSDDEIFARLIEAVTLETERSVLWRAIVRQRRRLVVDAPLARELTLEPVTAVVSLTRWTDSNAAEVVPAEVYHVSSSDPGGAGRKPPTRAGVAGCRARVGCLRAHLRLRLGGQQNSSGHPAHDSDGDRRAVPEHRPVCGCRGARPEGGERRAKAAIPPTLPRSAAPTPIGRRLDGPEDKI